MANPNDFLLNTDYEMDKIILFNQGEFTNTIQFSHKLGFTPLIFGVWSTDADFYSVNPINGEIDNSVLSVRGIANASNVTLTAGGNSNNRLLRYRVYGLMPSNINKAVQPTARFARKFAFNTDYNYCKLMRAGIFTHSGEEFHHNLSYIPQVIAWSETNNGIRPLTQANEQTGTGLRVTGNRLICGSGVTNNIHWRIYYDEA